MAVSARHGRHRTRTGTAGYAVIPPSCRRAFRARFYPRYSHEIEESMASKGGSRSWQIQARCNLLERGPLGRADVLPALPVSVGDPFGEVEHEPLVVLKLLRRRLALEHANRIAKMLQTPFFEFPGMPPLSWTPERWVGTVRSGGEDVRPCQGDRTSRGRTRRSFGVKRSRCIGAAA